MIRLNLAQNAEWIDLGDGVEVLNRPVTTLMIAAARESAAVQAVPDEAGTDHRIAVLTAAIGALAIEDWRGIALEDGETPAPVTPEAIAALMAIYPVSRAYYAKAIAPALVLVAEKNVSSPSPNGTTAAAMTIAAPATASAPSARARNTAPKH